MLVNNFGRRDVHNVRYGVIHEFRGRRGILSWGCIVVFIIADSFIQPHLFTTKYT